MPTIDITVDSKSSHRLDANELNPAGDAGAFERGIDQHVYTLYGLTPEEIKIVEEARV